MLAKLFFQIVAGIIGIFLAIKLVTGVEFSGSIQSLLIAGTILGLVNFFIKPILKIITLPITMLTLGLFSLVLNMVLIWLVLDVLLSNVIEIHGLLALFWTTIIVWMLNLIFELYHSKRK